MNGVQSYDTKQTIAVPPIGLLDDRNTLLLSYNDGSNDRQLYVTNNTVEVYRNDLVSFQTLYVTSLPLESDCIPWYINGSSIHDNGIFFVQYRGECGYTEFLYDFETGEFDEPRYIQKVDIIVATLDDYDVTISISDNRQEIKLDTTETGSTSYISADKISTDCSEFRSIFPLDPLEEKKVFFAIVCSTSEGKLRNYNVEYQYLFSPINLTVTSLDPGLPVSNSRCLAVRNTNSVSVYDRHSLNNGVPGRHPFTGQVQNVIFHEIANLTWLSVQLESNNEFVINVSLFIASRGDQGVYELPDTNVDCIPSCLPMVATETELILVTVDKDNTYSCVVFSFSTGEPEETRRITNLPERPFAITFVPDPSYQPPETPTAPIIPDFINVGVIVGPTVAVVVILVVMVIIVISFLARSGKLFSSGRSGYQSTPYKESSINISYELHDEDQPDPPIVVNTGVAPERIPPPADNPSTVSLDDHPTVPAPTAISSVKEVTTPGTPTKVVVYPRAPSRPKNLLLPKTSEEKEPVDTEATDDDPKTPLIPQQVADDRPIQENGVPVPETNTGAEGHSEYEVSGLLTH